MDRAGVQDWLTRYVEAWRSYDPQQIGALFSEDADYRYHPYDEGDDVVHGRDAIVRAWLDGVPAGIASAPDGAGTYDARYEPYAVDGDRAVAVGWTRYWTDASRQEQTEAYHNVFLLRFDADGRCTTFTEFFVKRPRAGEP